MRRKKYVSLVIALFAILILLGQCAKEKKESKFPEDFFIEDSTRSGLKQLPYFISTSERNWNLEFIGAFEDFDSLSARFSNLEGDTVKNLIIALDKYNNAVKVLRYEKEFFKDAKKYYVVFGKSDTLFCYYKDVTDQKVFVTGEYSYRGSHMGFDQNERKYYLLHKDSLDKVRGNNLPKLPMLTEVELEVYKKLFDSQ